MKRDGARPLDVGLPLFFACLCIQILAQIILALVIDPDGPGNTVEIAFLGQLAAAVAAVLVLVRLPGEQGPAAAGLNLDDALRGVARAAGAYAVFVPFFIFAVCPFNAWITGGRLQELVTEYQEHPELGSSPIYLFLVCAGVPILEEFLFRGVLYGGLRRRFSAGASIIVSGLLFALLHGWVAILPIAALGFFLGWVRERSGSLIPVMAVHAIHNSWTLLLAGAAL